ncbi:hypothetical protein Leryth_000977 [Lithospermum erythrorhizon]|nr:hypothetical protein Leryth_000977 [Lithospermum erythrorhizon]
MASFVSAVVPSYYSKSTWQPKNKEEIGRKVLPPKNSTNTEVKSKEIILPEQSIAADKSGYAVSKKGLTLKELLQHTSHHNVKSRRDALNGIRDIFIRHPAELKLHKLAVIEKLRERISDDDKLVREALYQLLKSEVFTGSNEENQELVVSLMMSYIFSAMTHLTFDIRLMAFKFLDLLLQHYPSSSTVYIEKILQNYGSLLRKNQFSLQDRSKLKSVLAGLVHCLSLLGCNKGAVSCVKMIVLKQLYIPLSLMTKKIKFVTLNTPTLDAQSFDCMQFILQSVDAVVKYFTHGFNETKRGLLSLFPPSKIPDVNVDDHMISLLKLKNLWDVFPLNPIHNHSTKDGDRYFILNAITTEVFLQLSDMISFPPALFERFLEFIEVSFSEKISHGRKSSLGIQEKHLISIIKFIPRLIVRIPDNWKARILLAFTTVLRNFSAESSTTLAFLSAVQEMLSPEHCWLELIADNPEILEFHLDWIQELPSMLVRLGDKHPSSSEAALRLQLKLGQCAPLNSLLSSEYDNMKKPLRDFYCTLDEESVHYGPFISLPGEIQELSVCCLYYFSSLDHPLLQSLVSCCLSNELDPNVIFRILEVLQSAHKAGHIHTADYLSFLVTLVSHFKTSPDEIFSTTSDDMKSSREIFNSVTSFVCLQMSQMGDKNLISKMLERVIIDQIMLLPHVDTICAFLRVLVTLDSRLTRFSVESIDDLTNVLAHYLIYISSSVPGDDVETAHQKTINYYFLPCLILFIKNRELLKLVLNKMGSFIDEYNSPSSSLRCGSLPLTHASLRLRAVVSTLLHMNKDSKVHGGLLSCQTELETIQQKMLTAKSSEATNMSIEERHKIQNECDRMKAFIVLLFQPYKDCKPIR